MQNRRKKNPPHCRVLLRRVKKNWEHVNGPLESNELCLRRAYGPLKKWIKVAGTGINRDRLVILWKQGCWIWKWSLKYYNNVDLGKFKEFYFHVRVATLDLPDVSVYKLRIFGHFSEAKVRGSLLYECTFLAKNMYQKQS